MSLTQDEHTVLLIAARDQFMMAIGRWEKPIKDLTARGLMHMNDPVNYVITQQGRVALERYEHEENQQLADALNSHRTKLKKQEALQKPIQEFIEQAAVLLADAAKASAKATGHSERDAAVQWGRVLVTRTLEIIRG